MKTKYILSRMAIPILFFTCYLTTFQTQAAITIEMYDDQVFVRTDEIGTAGYQGCTTGNLKRLPAYVYTLYRKEYTTNRNDQTCPTTLEKWVEVGRKESNFSEAIFLDMPRGEYRATIYSGQAIGCDIESDTQAFPSKSIVYLQEKSNGFNFLDNHTEALKGRKETKDVLLVFPNPTSGDLYIQLENHSLKTNAHLVFYNLLGQEVRRFSRTIDDALFMEWRIDVSRFPEGTYLLKVSDDEGTRYEQKVLVINNK